MYFIGIDVAKFKHDVCVIDEHGEILLKPTTFNNDATGFNYCLSLISSYIEDRHIIGLESTGIYGNNLMKFLFDNGASVALLNPLVTDAFRKTSLRKTKTDKIDTINICRALSTGRYSKLRSTYFKLIELKHLTRFYQELTASSSELKVKITGCLDLIFPEYKAMFSTPYTKAFNEVLKEYPSADKVSKANIIKLTNILKKYSHGKFNREKADKIRQRGRDSIAYPNSHKEYELVLLIEQLELHNAQIEDCLKKIEEHAFQLNSPIFSIRGIGLRTGATILGEIMDISRFNSSKALLAYAGCDPSVYQSGQYDNPRRRLSKRGSPYLRKALYQAALSVSLHSDTFKQYYNKKIAQGKPHRNALGHVVNKLVRVIYTILTNDVEFIDSYNV